MKKQGRFRLGNEFPHEGFVQRAIEDHFSHLGFRIESESYVDLVCVHPDTGERWHIEAKGLTSDVGLDFRTGLGQLVQRMKDETTKYGCAVPDIPKFRRQYQIVAPWVRQRLNLYWLLVLADGTVRMIGPQDTSC